MQFTKGKASVTEDASRSMVQSLVDDATSQTRGVQLVDVIDWRWIARSVLFLGIIGVLATAGWFVFRGIAPVLWERVFLSETAIPRNTQIVSTSGDLRIGVGDAVKITAVAEGVVPEDGQLRVTFISGRDVDYPLVADPETAGAFAAKIEDVPESFAYEIRLNDAKSGGHEVTAIARPEVDSVEGVQIYPEYTAIPESRHAPGDFHLFPGSQFTLNIKASKPIESATLRLIGLDKETPVKVSESDPSHLVAPFEVLAESLTGFSITLKDRDGMDSREPAVYRVELLGDEPPKVRITYPRRTEELVTAKARFLVAFEATDRFGIGAVSLRYKVNDGEPKAIELDIDEEPKPVTSLKRQYEWALTEIEPPVVEGDILEYWIEAVDLNKVEPGVGESEHLMARVVSAAEKREDLLSRASDYLGSVGAATDDQERLNNDLGKIIREKR